MNLGILLAAATLGFLLLYRTSSRAIAVVGFGTYGWVASLAESALAQLMDFLAGTFGMQTLKHRYRTRRAIPASMPDNAQKLRVWRFAGSCVITAVLLAGALYVIVTNAPSGQQKWAYGVVGSITGFWLRSGD